MQDPMQVYKNLRKSGLQVHMPSDTVIASCHRGKPRNRQSKEWKRRVARLRDIGLVPEKYSISEHNLLPRELMATVQVAAITVLL